jgi:hypothetical protein
MAIAPDAIEESRRLVSGAAERGVVLRLLGGLAVRLHCASAGHRALARKYPDLDFACPDKQGAQVESYLAAAGYEPNKTFNLLNGNTRMLFYDEPNERQIDIFIGRFDMCHHLPLARERLEKDPLTLPLAELLLTKLQVVQMNEKDVRDICALLLDHPFGEGDDEMFNLAVIARLCGDDWGWWKTVNVSADKVKKESEAFGLEPDQRARLDERIAQLKHGLEAAPKSLKWRLRARVGERLPWYDLPEEVQRG